MTCRGLNGMEKWCRPHWKEAHCLKFTKVDVSSTANNTVNAEEASRRRKKERSKQFINFSKTKKHRKFIV